MEIRVVEEKGRAQIEVTILSGPENRCVWEPMKGTEEGYIHAIRLAIEV